jgi:hypothetical protein
LDGGVIEADAPERADLFAMLGSYESRVIPGSKK